MTRKVIGLARRIIACNSIQKNIKLKLRGDAKVSKYTVENWERVSKVTVANLEEYRLGGANKLGWIGRNYSGSKGRGIES